MSTSREELLYLADQQVHARGMMREDDAADIRESKVIEYGGSASSTVRAEMREALEFYADPFAWKKKHDPEDLIRVPDFYSETSFGDTAVEALAAIQDGGLWRHKKRGTVYRILHDNITMQEEQTEGRRLDAEPMVVYQDVKSGAVYVRPVVEMWDSRFEQIQSSDGGVVATTQASSSMEDKPDPLRRPMGGTINNHLSREAEVAPGPSEANSPAAPCSTCDLPDRVNELSPAPVDAGVREDYWQYYVDANEARLEAIALLTRVHQLGATSAWRRMPDGGSFNATPLGQDIAAALSSQPVVRVDQKETPLRRTDR